MKKSLPFILFTSLFIFTTVFGQKGSLLITFKATDYYSNDTLSLDSVFIENPARDCDTTIYGNPPELLLTWVTGIEEFPNQGSFQVAQNYPNPFVGSTRFDIMLPGEKDLTLTLRDVYGKKLAVTEKTLQRGGHTFTIETGSGGIYFLTVSDGTASKTLKLNSMNAPTQSSFGIRYAGSGNMPEGFKASRQTGGFTFLPGDVLNCTPYLYGYEGSTIETAPATDYTAYFVLKPNRLNFLADTLTGYAPLFVHFHPTSNIPFITQWHWDFGDGETSDEQYPEHTYQTQDTAYTVSLTVTTNDNESITIEKPDYITLLHDVASVNFTANLTYGAIPFTVHFYGYTNLENVWSWQWNFGDGTTVQDIQNPVHTYEAAGTYHVALQIIAQGGTVSEYKANFIHCYDPPQCPSTVTDADGNVYGVVAIGQQCWMSENLNVGTMIDKVTGASGFQTNNNVVEKFCYDNDIDYCDDYGGLYQWDEAMQYVTTEGAQGICPYGWHIPTDEEWIKLEDFVDVSSTYWHSTGWRGEWVGKHLKSTESCWWFDTDDYYDFSILGAGLVSELIWPYFFKGECNEWGLTWAAFWTSTKKLGQKAWLRSFTTIYSDYEDFKSWRGTRDRVMNAYSIRCVKDSDK